MGSIQEQRRDVGDSRGRSGVRGDRRDADRDGLGGALEGRGPGDARDVSPVRVSETSDIGA